MMLLKRKGGKNTRPPKPSPSKFQGKPFAFTWNYSEFLQKHSSRGSREPTGSCFPLPCPFVHMGCSWPSCEAGPLAGAQIPSAPQGASPGPPGSPPWNRARRCRIWGPLV